jgi:hypothetical protein
MKGDKWVKVGTCKLRGGLSKGDALYVERKRMSFTYCIKTFCDEEGEGIIFLIGNGLLLTMKELIRG